MLLLDVNVLLAAHREDHPHHASVRPWFDELLAGGDDFGAPAVVWSGFLRLTTNRRVFEVPSSLADAFAFAEAVVAQRGYLPIEPGPGHLARLRGLCEDADATGELVPDAVLAAIALEHGATVATLDRDFARFEGIDRLRPG